MKKFLSIGNLRKAYDFPEMDKKGNKRGDGRPRVRKEDISKPVDFRHVDGYKKGQDGCITARKGSMSACTSPTFNNGPEFFTSTSVPNDPYRYSDSSQATSEVSYGKENRFCSGERYSQYTNEEEMYENARSSFGENNETLRRSKNSGSLRNLNFLQFAKQANPPGQKIKGDNSPKSKRLSLGSLLSSGRSSFTPSDAYPPPPSPIYEIPAEKGLLRRRSSSFNGGDGDIVQLRHNHQAGNVITTAPVRENADNPRTSIFNWTKKKPKYSEALAQEELPPPMSPSYDQLPPPPAFQDEEFNGPRVSLMPLPECPSYSDLPPPPPQEIVPQEETTLVTRRGFTGSPLSIPQDEEEFPPPSPSPAKVTTPEESNSGTIKRRPKLPPPNVRPPAAPSVSTLERKVAAAPAWRTRAVKVNAPTIPSECVPFVKAPSKEGSPVTPDSWPLAPTYPYVENGDSHYEEIEQYPPPLDSPLESKDFASLPNLSQLNSSSQPQPVESKKVDRDHLKPLSRLLQQRVPVDLWPVVMTQLFSTCRIAEDAHAKQIHSGSAAYTELITKTLELLIEMKNGDVSFEEVISAFEKTQKHIEE